VLRSIETAVVLAGGEGLRLRPFTLDVPKAMVLVAGRPLLEWILIWLRENAIKRVILGVAYRKNEIIEHFRDGRDFDIDIEYSLHSVKGGTAEGFRLAISRFVTDESFLAMNGDELSNISVAKFNRFHLRNSGVATVAVAPLRSPYGVVEIRDKSVARFLEKPIIHSYYVSIGIYAFQRTILDYLPKIGNIEQTTFPRLVRKQLLKAYVHKGFWSTVNTMKDLRDVEAKLAGKT
jgi:mannose-1-phosphate guanylyltransferase